MTRSAAIRAAGWLTVAGLLTAAVISPATTLATQPGPTHEVTICHRTDSMTNPYVVETVDVASVDGKAGNDHGHGDHLLEDTGTVWTPTHPKEPKWGDIIPPLYADGTPDGMPSLNWDAAGQAIFANHCDPVTTTTTTTSNTTSSATTYAETTETQTTTANTTSAETTETETSQTTTADTTTADTTTADTTTAQTTTADTTTADTTTADTTTADTTTAGTTTTADTTTAGTTTADTTTADTTTADTTTADTTTADTTTADTTTAQTTTADTTTAGTTTTADTTTAGTTTSQTTAGETTSQTTTAGTTASQTTAAETTTKSKPSPSGDVLSETGAPQLTPPPTDAIDGTGTPVNGSWRLVILAVAGLLSGLLVLTPATARKRR